ncbi:MAG: L-histidine N(alpha)-methyltransferase [Betaproteobacteria bacterium]|nr:L-histidine N(alpha)-methyltransferase [Betaproteobacteria bacterium]
MQAATPTRPPRYHPITNLTYQSPAIVPQPRIIEWLSENPEAERRTLQAGLLENPAAIAPKYFYDALGCALFAAICELPEYYPTRTERAIFDACRGEIGKVIGRGKQFVDLGAGDGRKAREWFPILAPSRYIAIDIAKAAMAQALAALSAEFSDVQMLGVVADFTHGLNLQQELGDTPVTFFYPGSSIGNFTPGDAREFLEDIHLHCLGRNGSGLLIGVDTKKDPRRLSAAYDDATGVTAAFNRNVLNHVNRILGTDFQPAAFTHRAFYNSQAGRVEMHLEAVLAQSVRLGNATRRFTAGERIHTENSYKYAPDEFTQLLQQAGFARVRCWQDEQRDFAVFYAA